MNDGYASIIKRFSDVCFDLTHRAHRSQVHYCQPPGGHPIFLTEILRLCCLCHSVTATCVDVPRMGKLLTFDNTVLHCLPLDKSRGEGVRQVRDAIYALVDPTPLSEARLVATSSDALALLGLDADEVHMQQSECISGKADVMLQMRLAMLSCTHQHITTSA